LTDSAISIPLHDGRALPRLGFGTWQVPRDIAAETVAHAIGAGYRLIDGARMYGNEAEVGDGVRRSGAARDDVWVTTKIWQDDHGRDRTLRAAEDSVKTFGIGPLDCILIHWPAPDRGLYVETWAALIDAREAGLCRSIGVSNFHPAHLDRLIEATGEAPVLNQVELHPGFPQPDLAAANATRGIATQAWAPLGRGDQFDAPAVVRAAERTGRSPVQVILRWHLQSGHAAIPRSTKRAHIETNADVFGFELSEEEMQAISAIGPGRRTGPDPDTFS